MSVDAQGRGEARAAGAQAPNARSPRAGHPAGDSAPRPSDGGWPGYRDSVREVLADELSVARRRPGILSPNFGRLWARLEGTLEGGKWMRPRLVHYAYRAFGGDDQLACARLGASFEMLHASLVIHDDVIDRDFVRRGAPTVGALYRDDAAARGHGAADAEHAGHSASIIAGDLLLAGSIKLAATAGTGSSCGAEVVDIVHGAILASAAGELDDLLYSLDPESVDLDQVLNMERLKTAAYSFEAPLHAGALLAGASADDARQLGDVGRRIGTAYQVIDDVLGTFGRPEVTGKSAESDLRAGKRTVLTAYAAQHVAFQSELAAFRAGASTIDALRAALRETGAEAHAVDLAARLVAAALQQAENLRLEPALLDELAGICHHVLNREK